MPSLSPGLREKSVVSLGQKGYKITFALLILVALVLIVLGWRSTVPVHIYTLPEIVRLIAILLIVMAFLLMGAANYPTRIKQFVRHPQLTGVIFWSTAHLLLNGDSRSVLLFGWLGIWALLEIVLISRREGEWIKAVSPSWSREARGAFISLIVLAVVVFVHPYLAGVPVS
jgi:uncharacterized membrane protein